MKLWLALFCVGLPAACWLSLREPIWCAAVAGYLYFAIPNLEFNAPEAPYQAAFWALAILTSFRYRELFPVEARRHIDSAALAAVRKVIASVRAELKERVVEAALTFGRPREIRAQALTPVEQRARAEVEQAAPWRLLEALRRAVSTTLGRAADAGEAESLRVLAQAGTSTKGVLRHSLESRVPATIDGVLDAEVDARALEETERAVTTFEEKRRDAPPGTGPLGIPVPRGPVFGLLGNAGLWVHVLFTILTFVSAQYAKYDVMKAMTRFDQCQLLFLPMIGIVCAVRNDRHARIFVYAWVAGTLHLCMNAITWWFHNGGRADAPGGQGNESNFLGAIIVTIAPVSFGLIVNSKEWRMRGLWSVLAGIFALGVLASGSRAALIAYVGCAGYWFFHTNRKGFALGGVMIAASCFLTIAPDDFWERMGTILTSKDRNPWVQNEVEPSKHEREVLWALAIDIFKENPWMGIGPRQYPLVSAEQTDFVDAYNQVRGLQTHNVWLQLAAEYGLLGIFVWGGGFFLSAFCYRAARWKLLARPGQEHLAAICLGLEAGSIGSAIACTFNSFQWYDYHYWHFVFGPLMLQIAGETMEREGWLLPGRGEEARPPPRYGPPIPFTEGLPE